MNAESPTLSRYTHLSILRLSALALNVWKKASLSCGNFECRATNLPSHGNFQCTGTLCGETYKTVLRHSVSRRGCPSDSKCCLKTADLSQHSSDCLQDTSVPRHARLSRDISGSARAMACVETGRLITAPCVARREVQNRRRTEIGTQNPRASGTVQ